MSRLSTEELGVLLERAKKARVLSHDGFHWPSALVTVCRQALKQQREIERLKRRLKERTCQP